MALHFLPKPINRFSYSAIPEKLGNKADCQEKKLMKRQMASTSFLFVFVATNKTVGGIQKLAKGGVPYICILGMVAAG